MLTNLENHREPPAFDFNEQNVGANDGSARKGRAIIDSGAKWKGRLLADIRNGTSFTITVDHFDGLTNTSQRIKTTYEVTDAWRRGFEIAIGVCEGATTDGPGQQRIKATLAPNSKGGFDAGQEVQLNRTNPFGFLVKVTAQENRVLGLSKPDALKEGALVNATFVQGLAAQRG
jgi:hypothetical protein